MRSRLSRPEALAGALVFVRVLLTGAARFIGSTIADRLLAGGVEVVSLDLLIPQAHGDRPPRWAPSDLRVGDVRDPGVLADLLTGVDAVCHQAAMVGLGADLADLPDYLSHNAVGTATLLAAMSKAGVGHLVQASSMVVYGEGAYRCPVDGPVRPGSRSRERLDAGLFEPPCPVCGGELTWRLIDETSTPDPRNAYAIGKLAQEQLARVWAEQTGGSALSLRYHNVYGPRMPRDTPYSGVAAIFRSALADGRAPVVYEDGRQMRDFVHVADVARANVLALHARQVGGTAGVCTIASGEPHSVGDLAVQLSKSVGGPAPRIVGGGRPGDVRHVVADPRHAREILGFRAEIGFDQGVEDFASSPLRESAAI